MVPVQAFSDIKNYYNDITHNNLDLIKTLKEDVTEMKKKDSQNEKLMFEIAQENKRLSEPLQKVIINQTLINRFLPGQLEPDTCPLNSDGKKRRGGGWGGYQLNPTLINCNDQPLLFNGKVPLVASVPDTASA